MPKVDGKKSGGEDPPNVRLALGADLVKTVGPKALRPEPRPPTVAKPGGVAPTVRLVGNGNAGREDMKEKALRPEDPPSVRLSVTIEGGKKTSPVGEEAMARHLGPPPSVRLAHVPGAQGDNVLLGQRGVAVLPLETRPALLVSYVYLAPFLENRHRYAYRDWALDSGAFSAQSLGVPIDLGAYVEKCKELMASDPTLTDIFALDVIGDWKASVKNAELMWAAGVPAIPTFHYGSPWDVLKGIARDYPKIALGGCVGRRDKDAFAQQCFARVWPCRIHGFGFGSERSIMLLPFHSVDATNWELAPCKFGHWKAFGGQRVSVRGSSQNLRAEVEWYLDLERQAREKWKEEMKKLPGDLTELIAVRLAYSQNRLEAKGRGSRGGRPDPLVAQDDEDSIAVRLAMSGSSDVRTGSAKSSKADLRAVALRPEGTEGVPPVVRLAHKESGREGGKGLAEDRNFKPKRGSS